MKINYSILTNLILISRFHLQICKIAEGAFKKLKPEPNSGLSTVSAGVTSPGSGLSSLSHHAGHTPTTASCPTPARRRHRTTFTQVSYTTIFIHTNIHIYLPQANLRIHTYLYSCKL